MCQPSVEETDLRRPNRRLLTKRGWLGRVVRRWCEVVGGDLVYYGSKDCQQARGRISLKECHVSEASESHRTGNANKGHAQRQPSEVSVVLVRSSKRVCAIHFDSQNDREAFLIGLRGKVASSPSSLVPPLPPQLPASPSLPVVPPAGSPAHRLGLPSVSHGSLPAEDFECDDDAAVIPDEFWPSWEQLPAAHIQQPSKDKRTGAVRDCIAASVMPGPSSSLGSLVTPLPPHCGDVVSLDNLDFLCSRSSHQFEEPVIERIPTVSSASSVGHISTAVAEHCDWSMPATPCEFFPSGQLEQRCSVEAGATDASTADTPSVTSIITSPRVSRLPKIGEGGDSHIEPRESYRQAMAAMWNYELDRARVALEPFRTSTPWHASAFAECLVLRVMITGRHSEAHRALELVRQAEALLESHASDSIVHQIFVAELALFRSGLQVILGARFRALFNLRQCWHAYRRLETNLPSSGLGDFLDPMGMFTPEDLRGRVCLGLGLFYLATSLLTPGLSPLLRLAGFVMDRERGKALLAECVEWELGVRAIPAAIMLSMYHLDLEPNVPRAGDLLVASLGRKPENVLLHWGGSFLAWRNTCITQAAEMTEKAIWCCGEEMGGKALFLRYELGVLHLLCMRWSEAHLNLRFVHQALHADDERVFFPYKTLVATQLAACAFNLGLDEEGMMLCSECGPSSDWSGGLRIEGDFAKLSHLFLKRRPLCRKLLAFEMIYLLRQFPKIPPSMLADLRMYVRQLGQPFAEHVSQEQADYVGSSSSRAADSQRVNRRQKVDTNVLVELVSARVVECVILFYLADVDQAMTFVPRLWQLCVQLPSWSAYLAAHGLYWCGRILALAAQPENAIRCLRQAKAVKKYPFGIHEKILKVLMELESGGKRGGL
mmetsp:Transcript_141558/g.359575  ORF Transcript_141558/g.359575 Transcript_141558/m.359575 type:complete len:887 (-) Transcript_141558:50-2710(-)